MSGFGGDGTRVRFWLPDGTSFQTRPIAVYEVRRFTRTLTLVAVGCVFMLIALFAMSGRVLTPGFVMGFQVVGGLLCALSFVTSQYDDNGRVAWREVLVYGVCAYMLQISATYGFFALFTMWTSLFALIGLIVAGVSYVSDIIERRVWEPLASASLFLALITMICASKHATVSYVIGATIATLVVSLISLLLIWGASGLYEKGLYEISDGGE